VTLTFDLLTLSSRHVTLLGHISTTFEDTIATRSSAVVHFVPWLYKSW